MKMKRREDNFTLDAHLMAMYKSVCTSELANGLQNGCTFLIEMLLLAKLCKHGISFH